MGLWGVGGQLQLRLVRWKLELRTELGLGLRLWTGDLRRRLGFGFRRDWWRRREGASLQRGVRVSTALVAGPYEVERAKQGVKG